MAAEREPEYYSKDFDWEVLREEVESDPSLCHHLAPFGDSSSAAARSPTDAEAWRSFHRRHYAGTFFKERRYLLKEFPELVYCNNDPTKVLEVGCGNGSTVLPIIRDEVLEKAKEIVATTYGVSAEHRFHPFILDFSINCFPEWLFCSSCQNASLEKLTDFSSDGKEQKFPNSNEPSFLRSDRCCIGGVDFVTLVFTLSAVPSQKMFSFIVKCISVLKPGGLLLFRDYGLYDMTMLRFLPEQRVGFREYMRSDGTLSYFFSLETVRDLFLGAGFIELELNYCCVRSANRRTGKKMQRVWVHGKFKKPL